MRSFRWPVLIGVIALVTACRSPQPQQAAAPAGPGPVAPLRDVMHMIVESQAQVIFDSVAITVTEAGTQERQPQTEEDWDAVLHSAITLAEAANLLTTPGRPVARPEDMNTSADPVELTPAQIQEKMTANPESWLKHAKNLQDVAMQAVKAATDKNVQALWNVGEPIDQACESCHLEFWYPDDVRPAPPQ
jgi:cytochrome c556